MGEVKAKIYLENAGDIALKKRGYIDKIRALEIEGIVDTGATRMMLPQDVVETLGLDLMGKVIVRYADERQDERELAGIVKITVCDRAMGADCVVGPPLSEPLIGQIILEGLDLVVDCITKTLRPHPESPYLPHLKMKKFKNMEAKE